MLLKRLCSFMFYVCIQTHSNDAYNVKRRKYNNLMCNLLATKSILQLHLAAVGFTDVPSVWVLDRLVLKIIIKLMWILISYLFPLISLLSLLQNGSFKCVSSTSTFGMLNYRTNTKLVIISVLCLNSEFHVSKNEYFIYFIYYNGGGEPFYH